MVCLKRLGIILGFSFVIFCLFNYKSKYDINDSYVEGYIDKYKFDGDKLSLEVIGKERIICNYYFDSLDEKNYFLVYIKYGQVVYLNGKMKIPQENSNFDLFNYRLFLKSKKINFIFNVSDINFKENSNILYGFKNYLFKRIGSMNSPYLFAFILGDTSYIDDDALSSYQVNGVSHLLAISGMHITFLFNALYGLLNKIKRSRFNIFIIGILLFIYLFLVSFSPSSVRAGIMFLVSKVKRFKSYYVLICLFFIFLIYNPYFVFSVGFLLSFVVTFYILFFNDLIDGSYFKRLFFTSLIAFIASSPILIYNYNSINLLSVFLNLLFVPFVSYVIFPLSFISLLIGYGSIFNFLINVMESVSLFFSSVSFELILRDIGMFILIYVFIGLFVLFMFRRKKYFYFIIFFIFMLFHYCLFNFYPVISFLDVGQGDSILIEFPFNKGNVLIDTGGSICTSEWKCKDYSIADRVIIPYLKKRGIKNLDYLIITHGDYDHMGESRELIKNFKVLNVIFNNGDFNDLEFDLIDLLRKEGISYYSGLNGISVNCYNLDFLNDVLYNNENDNSNVIYTKINGFKLLFMGDAGIKVEDDLIKKYDLSDIDIFKVGHHGSKTSSGKDFIDFINPKYSVISVSKNNMYGHPNSSVLSNLEKSKIYRTDQNGSIMFKLKNDKLLVKTCIP